MAKHEIRVFAPWLVGVVTFIGTPISGGTIGACNWFRVREYRRAAVVSLAGWLALASMIGASALAGATIGMVLIFALGLVYAVVAYYDQTQLRQRYPDIIDVRWYVTLIVGACVFGCMREIPTLIWILTGDSSNRPEWMGPAPAPPCPALATKEPPPEAAVFAAWPMVRDPTNSYEIRYPEAPEHEETSGLGVVTMHRVGLLVRTPPGGYFGVLTHDLTEHGWPEGRLDGYRDGAMETPGRTFRSEVRVPFAGGCARDLRYSDVAQGVTVFGVSRIFNIDDRIYNVTVQSVDPRIDEWAPAWIDTFVLVQPPK